MKSITTSSFNQEVLNSNLPVMVKFTADFCMPCKKMQPILEELSQELNGKAHIYSIDIEEYPEIASQYKVRSIPTMMVFDGGQITALQVGSTTKDALLAMFPSKE